MIDFEKVVREAAVKNKIVIYKDDAVMLLATTINLMLDDLDVSLAAALDKYQKEHNEIARRWRLDAEGSAAKILDAALEAGREATAKTMNEGAAKAVEVIQEELVAAILHQRVELDAVAEEMKRHGYLMLGASGILLAVAVFISFM